jgi:uncharacterized repeat protein (TIGR01451 family)
MPWVPALLFPLILLLVAGTARAQGSGRAPRHSSDQHGNFLLIGNTLAQGCNAKTPSPLVGIVESACGFNVDDTSPDIFWTLRGAGDGAAAFASFSVTPLEASSQARLQLPEGARVTYARIYWAATRSNVVVPAPADRTPERPDTTADLSFEGPGAPETRSLTADVTFTENSAPGTGFQYQSSLEVTDFVRRHGSGLYRVGGVDAIDLRNIYAEFMFSSWWMVVFYELDGEPMRSLRLYDGLDIVTGGNELDLQLRGFHVPAHATEAKLGVIAFDGDEPDEGDWFAFNGTRMKNTLNPGDNFFNSTRSHQSEVGSVGTIPEASAVSLEGDLPRLSGTPWSMSGLDLDVVDVTLMPGDKTADLKIGTRADIFWMGGFVTSIATQRPDFRDTVKTVENLSRTDGTTRPGDRLRYTITTTNTGDDASVGTRFQDTLSAQLEYVSGTITVNGRSMTDRAGDDVATWVGNTLTVYLGRGATPFRGGEMTIGDSATVTFDVLVAASARGTVENQAVINAAGKLGTDSMDTYSRPVKGQPSGPTILSVTTSDSGQGGGTNGGSDGGTGGNGGGTGGDSDGGTEAGGDGDCGPEVGPTEPPVEYLVAGRGCSSSGGSLLPWLAALLLTLPLMRSRRMRSSARRSSVAAAGLVALGTLSAPQARAQLLGPASLSQAIDVQRYKPGPGATDLLGVYGAQVDRHLGWHLGASLTYASNPLGFLDKRQDDFVYQVVATQATLDLLGSVSFFDRFELGVALPLTYQASERGAAVTPAFAEGVNGGGVGDLRLVAKAHLLSSGALHLGVAIPVLLPTAGGQGFRGGAGVAVQPQVVGEWASGSGLRVVANLGAHLRGEERLSNLRAGDELSYALGASMPVGERLAVQAQLAGALGLTERNAEELPLELLASVRYRLRDGLRVHVGGGPGLTRGYGTPGFRLFAGIDWTQPGERAPASRPVLAHIATPIPVPTSAPVEPAPAAPAPAPVVERQVQGRSDKVILESNRIVILEKVYFATNKDVILDRSFELLNQVAVVLKNNPKVALLRVEGHTDDRGDDASNMDLSQRRASNVRLFLIEKGIAAERLEAAGYGETRPVDTNDTDAGRENNRRVEFTIVKDAGASDGT